MSSSYEWFVGVDWGRESHQVCALGAAGKQKDERSFRHSGKGAVNPKQLDRFRDRHTMAGAKDDRRDAFVLADSLRTDRGRFRELRVEDPLVVQLREMSRLDRELGEEITRLANRLWDQLKRYWPEVLELCPSADEPWFWALLERWPTPERAALASKRKVQSILDRHRIRRHTAAHVQATLKGKTVFAAPGTVEAASPHVAMLLPRLKLADTQRRSCEKRLDELLGAMAEGDDDDDGPHDVEVIRSFTGIGVRVAATIIAEAHQAIRDRDYASLRCHAGVAPVTRQSGKRTKVSFRYGCNHRLRYAVHHWSRVCVQHDERALAHYQALRLRGHNNARALRGVADRLLKVLIAMLRDQSTYESARRKSLPKTV
jgi:transposase